MTKVMTVILIGVFAIGFIGCQSPLMTTEIDVPAEKNEGPGTPGSNVNQDYQLPSPVVTDNPGGLAIAELPVVGIYDPFDDTLVLEWSASLGDDGTLPWNVWNKHAIQLTNGESGEDLDVYYEFEFEPFTFAGYVYVDLTMTGPDGMVTQADWISENGLVSATVDFRVLMSGSTIEWFIDYGNGFESWIVVADQAAYTFEGVIFEHETGSEEYFNFQTTLESLTLGVL